jgi:hypothetical protein
LQIDLTSTVDGKATTQSVHLADTADGQCAVTQGPSQSH